MGGKKSTDVKLVAFEKKKFAGDYSRVGEEIECIHISFFTAKAAI